MMSPKTLLDTGKLLLGHFANRRAPGMQDIASYYARQEGWTARMILGVVNASLHLRRFCRVRIVHRWSTMRSRRAFSLSGRSMSVRKRRISLLCPTRGRARQAREMVESVRATASDPGRVELFLYVDSDDPQLESYQRIFARDSSHSMGLAACTLMVGTPMSVSKSWNVLARASRGDVLAMANDDQVYVDFGWDDAVDRVAGEFPDDVFCLYFDAGQYVEGGADFPMVSRKWYETLGYFTPGIFQFWFNEHWIFDVARRVGRLKAIDDIFVDHLHFSDFLSPFDPTYRRHRLTRERASADQNLYAASETLRERAARALRRVMSR